MNQATVPLLFVIAASGVALGLIGRAPAYKARALLATAAGLVLAATAWRYAAWVPVSHLWLRSFWYGPAFVRGSFAALLLWPVIALVPWSDRATRWITAVVIAAGFVHVTTNMGSNDFGSDVVVALVEGVSAVTAAALGVLAGVAVRSHLAKT